MRGAPHAGTTTMLLMLALGVGCGSQTQPPRGAWQLIESAHFVVRTDATPDRYQPVLEHLEDMHEALSGTFFTGLPLPPIDVLLFADERDFKAIARENLVGFYSSNVVGLPGGLLVFSAQANNAEAQALVTATAAHELGHRFLVEVSERIPTWLHEGFAEYVGASRIAGDRVIFDGAANLPTSKPPADLLPLELVMASSAADFHGADARSQYMTAWMLMRQLLRAPAASSLARFHRLAARSAAASSAHEQAAAVREAFPGTEPEDLERAIEAAHDGLLEGVHVPDPSGCLTAVLHRRARRPPAVAPLDRLAVDRLIAELRPR